MLPRLVLDCGLWDRGETDACSDACALSYKQTIGKFIDEVDVLLEEKKSFSLLIVKGRN